MNAASVQCVACMILMWVGGCSASCMIIVVCDLWADLWSTHSTIVLGVMRRLGECSQWIDSPMVGFLFWLSWLALYNLLVNFSFWF